MSGVETREIEKKFLINTKKSLTKIFSELIVVYGDYISGVTVGSGTDYFFSVDKASILRVREYDEGGGEVTVKTTDKDTIVDREEINIKLSTANDVKMAKLLISKLHGEPTYTVWKKYMIVWLEMLQGNVVIYQTDLKNHKGLILEVEAKSIRNVDKILSYLSGNVELKPIMKSLYELTVEDSNG
jgi:CYTH domain-containing protein